MKSSTCLDPAAALDSCINLLQSSLWQNHGPRVPWQASKASPLLGMICSPRTCIPINSPRIIYRNARSRKKLVSCCFAAETTIFLQAPVVLWVHGMGDAGDDGVKLFLEWEVFNRNCGCCHQSSSCICSGLASLASIPLQANWDYAQDME